MNFDALLLLNFVPVLALMFICMKEKQTNLFEDVSKKEDK